MKRKYFVSIPLILIVTTLAGDAAAQQPSEEAGQVLLSINPAGESPAIDGELNDAAWKEGAWVWEFWTGAGIFPSPQRTEACVLYSTAEIFIAFRCFEKWMTEIVVVPRERDGRVWEDDSVEVFIDRNRDRKTYYHFIANALGDRFDQIVSDVRWDADWRVGTARGDGFWTAEIAIPFSALGGPPKPGEIWNLNLNRERKPRPEVYAWSFTGPSFHVPSRFGAGVFLTSPVGMEVKDTGDLFLGPGEITLAVRAAAESGWIATAITRGENSLHTERTVLRADKTGEEKVFSVPYRVTEAGEGVVELEVTQATSGEVRLRRVYPYTIAEAQDRLQDAEVSQIRAEEAAAELVEGSPARGKATDLLAKYAAQLDQLRTSFAQIEELGRKGWEEQEARCERLVDDYRSLLLRADMSQVFRGGREFPDYAVTLEAPLVKVFPDAVPGGPVAGSLQNMFRDVPRDTVVSLARGEHEAIQLVLFPFETAIEDVAIEVSGVMGHRIYDATPTALPRVKFYEVGLVETSEPAYPVERVGEWPDPLVPFGRLTVPAGRARAVWVDVFAPPAVWGDDYDVIIVVRPANSDPVEIALRVHVWDFVLPAQSSLTTAFALSETAVKAFYGFDDLSPSLRREYYSFLLDHRLNPTDLYSPDPRPRREDVEYCLERGLTAFNVGHIQKQEMMDATREAELGARIAEQHALLEAEGWLPFAYLYAFDEPEPKDYDALKQVLTLVGEKAPGLRRSTTEPPVEVLTGLVDIWVPNLEEFQADAAAARREAGDEVWWYVASAPVHPYPNFFVDYPAIDHRIIPWMNWKWGATGLQYYSLNWGWLANAQDEGRWPDVPWNTETYSHYNGDGQLIYPGPEGTPWSSIRLELIRDGIEDYEYFSILKQRVDQAGDSPAARKAASLLDLPDEVVKSLTEYTGQPKVLLEYRARIAEAVEQLSGS